MDLTLLLIILIAVAFLLRVDFIFYIIYVCAGIYAWSRWYTPRILQQLEIKREFVDHAFLGETVPVKIQMHNKSRLPVPWVNFSESLAIELLTSERMNHVTSLRGKETAEYTYKVKAGRRGYYQLGPVRLTTGDLFGLFQPQRGRFPADYLTVYPRIIPLTQLNLPSRLPFGTITSRQPLFEDPARPIGVREYRSGDSLRQINWKVSAHTRHLVVKTHQPAISLETAVLLNLHSGDYHRKSRLHRIEWAIEVAASIAAHLVNKRQAVGLITNGVDPMGAGGKEMLFDDTSGRLIRQEISGTAIMPANIPPRPGRSHLMKILERLARIEGDETVPFDRWAATACHRLSWGVTLLTITARGDETTCQTIHRLARAGFNPILIAIEPDYNFGEVKERARQLGFSAYNVSQLNELDHWRRPQQVYAL